MPEKENKTFAELMGQWKWKPIRNCRGRYVLSLAPRDLPVEALTGKGAQVLRFRVEGARDIVAVSPLIGGGLIAYERPDGTVIHTLNDPDGFSRKLQQLGISPSL
jgi:hypothetical protein